MDIKNIIKNLNEFDVNDLKNLDYKQIALNMLKRKDILIMVVVIGISLGALIYIHMSRKKLTINLKSDLVSLEEKIKTVDTFDQIKKDLEQFLNKFPDEIPQDQLIETLNDFAISSNVEILTFSPAEIQNHGLYEQTTIRVTVLAQSYHDTWLFLKTIESSPFALRADNWRGSPEQVRDETGKVGIRSTIQFSSITLK